MESQSSSAECQRVEIYVPTHFSKFTKKPRVRCNVGECLPHQSRNSGTPISSNKVQACPRYFNSRKARTNDNYKQFN